MKTGAINSKWIGMSKAGRLDPQFWLKVLEEASRRKLDTSDDRAMQQLISEVESR